MVQEISTLQGPDHWSVKFKVFPFILRLIWHAGHKSTNLGEKVHCKADGIKKSSRRVTADHSHRGEVFPFMRSGVPGVHGIIRIDHFFPVVKTPARGMRNPRTSTVRKFMGSIEMKTWRFIPGFVSREVLLSGSERRKGHGLRFTVPGICMQWKYYISL